MVGLAAITLVFSAQAGTKFSVGDLKYETLEGGGCAVTGQDNEIKGELVIPNKVVYAGSEYNVVRVANYAFQNNTTITSVVFSGEIKEIGYCSFEYANVASVTLTGVHQIESYAFNKCPIQELVIPASVRSIDSSAFNCSSIKNLIFEDSEESLSIKDGWSSFNCTSLETLYFGRPFNESGSNFRPINTENLTTITFGPAVTFIPENFANNGKALTQINFGGNETEIGDYAFQKCSAIEEVALPDACKHVGYCTFEYCYSLVVVNLNKVETLSAYAFHECSLIDLFIPASVKVIESNSFNCSTIFSLEFEGGEQPLEIKDGWGSFNCSSLAVLTYRRPFNENGGNLRPNNAPYLGVVEFGPAVKFIPENFASNCPSLFNVHFSGNEIEIGDYAFQYCSDIPAIYLPKACKRVGYCAFEGCASLSNINLAKVETLDSYAFSKCTPVKLTIPASVRTIGSSTFNCPTIEELIFEDSVEPLEIKEEWSSVNSKSLVSLYYGRPFNENASNFRPANAKNLKTIKFGEAATFIPNTFASGCDALTKICFGGNEQRLENYCFTKCKALEEVTLPEACKSVGYCSFEYCESLSNLIMGENMEYIDAYAFSGAPLTAIACHAVEPPTIDKQSAFSDFAYKNATVYVPEGCLNKYKEAPIWDKFFNFDASGIQDLVADNIDFEMVGNQLHLNGQNHVSVYTINGKLVYSGRGNMITLPSGLYIISSNGHSAKVLSK